MKVALAMIVKDFNHHEPIMSFLKNAKTFGHSIDRVIIGWQNSCQAAALRQLSEQTKVTTVALRDPSELTLALQNQGLSVRHQSFLLPSDDVKAGAPMSYGQSRNLLVMTAMMQGMDVIAFIDDDVYPLRLMEDQRFETIDFLGGHIAYLSQDNIAATTSDYTGFDIVPNLPIEAWREYLLALHKQPIMGLTHVASENVHSHVRETDKLLGGNLALKVRALKDLSGFYSTILDYKGQRYLGRGEDTLLGLNISRHHQWQALDIDMRIFHDAFKDYPMVPDLSNNSQIKDRLFYASMGWIARNPLLDALNQRQMDWKRRHKLLLVAAPQMAEALQDERFNELPSAMLAAQTQLEQTQRHLEGFLEAWQALGRCLV